MPGGITCASILLYIQGGIAAPIFFGILFLLFFVFRMTPPEFWSNPDAPKAIALCVAIMLVFFLITVMPFLAAIRLRRGERILATLLGCISLINFPLGTAFGILILMGVFDRESAEWCARQRNARITP
jgi:heme/copper-type cytochrome/quinol oxidase subunit 3